MAKKICGICEKELGALSMKSDIRDGVVCSNCLTLAKIKPKNAMEHDTASLKELINKNAPLFFELKEMRAVFNPTKSIDKNLLIDENNKLFQVGKGGIICKFSDLVSFELLEDGETITKGGIRGAVVGGLLAGGVGSVVGSIVGNKSKDICKSMQIALTISNMFADTLYINLIGGIFTSDIPKSNIIYKDAQSKAKLCIAALKIITDENNAGINASPAIDTAAELQKFHDLMKNGVITEDEFNVKKAQLLGL